MFRWGQMKRDESVVCKTYSGTQMFNAPYCQLILSLLQYFNPHLIVFIFKSCDIKTNVSKHLISFPVVTSCRVLIYILAFINEIFIFAPVLFTYEHVFNSMLNRHLIDIFCGPENCRSISM